VELWEVSLHEPKTPWIYSGDVYFASYFKTYSQLWEYQTAASKDKKLDWDK
jgi:hypothetical protein